MRKLTLAVLGAVLFAFALTPATFAQISLQESNINVNGTQYYDTFAVPGLNTSSYNPSSGLGTLVLTFNPGAGSYYVTVYFDEELAVPFFNEYGTVYGSPAAGQSWQIDDPTFGTIFANAEGNTLDDTNHVPGTVDNFLGGCASVYAAGCQFSNDDVSWAMGFSFTLGAGQEEVITLTTSETPPGGGFYLRQTHPIDPNNASEVDAYFSGSAKTEAIPPTVVPEPGTLILVGTGILCLVRRVRR
jgi:hypothetical protein